jgi:hypothetical protein
LKLSFPHHILASEGSLKIEIPLAYKLEFPQGMERVSPPLPPPLLQDVPVLGLAPSSLHDVIKARPMPSLKKHPDGVALRV